MGPRTDLSPSRQSPSGPPPAVLTSHFQGPPAWRLLSVGAISRPLRAGRDREVSCHCGQGLGPEPAFSSPFQGPSWGGRCCGPQGATREWVGRPCPELSKASVVWGQGQAEPGQGHPAPTLGSWLQWGAGPHLSTTSRPQGPPRQLSGPLQHVGRADITACGKSPGLMRAPRPLLSLRKGAAQPSSPPSPPLPPPLPHCGSIATPLRAASCSVPPRGLPVTERACDRVSQDRGPLGWRNELS